MPDVDVLTAGYPCQPFSHAGRRKGTSDARHLWPHIADALGVLRPRLVVLENVAGHLSLGFDAVLSDLASLGFDAEWALVRASDVGACHQRARLFVVAWPADAQDDRLPGGGAARRRWDGPPYGREDAPHADGGRLEVSQEQHGDEAQDPADGSPRWGHPDGRDHVALWGAYAEAVCRHERVLGRSAPAPRDERGWLSPLFVEWMMMLPAGWVTDVLTTRTKALKCLGNGVVPPQAAYALSILLPRLAEPLAVAA